MRYWAARARLGADTAFDEKMFKIGRRLVTKLYNAGRFVLTQEGPRGEITAELDRAFAAELRALVERATAAFEEFEYSKALEETETFFWGHFTDNYLELVKRRARTEDDEAGRASALAGLRLGLSVLLRLFAPVLPTITEEVWSWAFAEETGQRSIHRAPWPGAADFEEVAAPANPESFALAADAIAAIRRARTEASLGMGRPLKLCRLRASAADPKALAPVQDDVVSAANAPSLETLANPPGDEAARFGAQIEAAPVE